MSPLLEAVDRAGYLPVRPGLRGLNFRPALPFPLPCPSSAPELPSVSALVCRCSSAPVSLDTAAPHAFASAAAAD